MDGEPALTHWDGFRRSEDPVFLQEHTIIENSLMCVSVWGGVCDKKIELRSGWSLREVKVQAHTQDPEWLLFICDGRWSRGRTRISYSMCNRDVKHQLNNQSN